MPQAESFLVDTQMKEQRLPIPIFLENDTFLSVEITKPKAKVLADTKKISDTGDLYTAILVFISGCVTSITGENTITEPSSIKKTIRKLPYKSAECLASMIIILLDDDDGVQGIYPCPMCRHKVVAELVEVDGEVQIDTRDFITDLEIKYLEEHEKSFEHVFNEPVSITANGEPVSPTVERMEFGWPTLENCINAYKKVGLTDEMRLQNQIYIESAISVNGSPVDPKWKNRFGTHVFDNITDVKNDLMGISKKISKYGLNPMVDKHCIGCGKDFKIALNTSNFFVSALQQS